MRGRDRHAQLGARRGHVPQTLLALLVGAGLASATHAQVDDPFGAANGVANGILGIDAVALADLDGDGDLDALCGSHGDDTLAWYSNLDGLGGFGPKQVLSKAFDFPMNPRAGDVDGDGDADVVIAGSPGIADDDLVGWLKNTDGAGSFGSLNVVTSVARISDVELADLDGDGDADLVLAAGDPFADELVWLENLDGLGTFAASQLIGGAVGIDDLRVVDLDGDGDLDVLAASDDGLLLFDHTDGAGTFAAAQVLDAARHWWVDVADIDRDGLLDVVAAGVLSVDRLAWFGQLPGGAGFGPAQTITTGEQGARLGDVDGDGDTDVVGGTWNQPDLTWWENREPGPGGFVAHVVPTPLLWDHALGDVDGDGDLDVLVGQSQGFKLSWYPCQLASPAWPFVGAGLGSAAGTPLLSGGGELSSGEQVWLSLTRSLPGSTATLVSGLSLLGAPLKGGVLVPNPDVVIVGLPVDGQGELLINATWPAGIPAGVPLWFQTWVVDASGPAGFAASNGLGGTTAD